MLLGGTVESEPVTLAILDHPSNAGYPTHWHARGYGLFAANPLGDKEFAAGNKEFNMTIEPGQSKTFLYRVPDSQQRSGARQDRRGLARVREGSGAERVTEKRATDSPVPSPSASRASDTCPR